MASQIVGYYSSRKGKLLKDFDASCALMRPLLVARYGEELANSLENEARGFYEVLIPVNPSPHTSACPT